MPGSSEQAPSHHSSAEDAQIDRAEPSASEVAASPENVAPNGSETSAPGDAGSEPQRKVEDRRRQATPMLSKHSLFGGRRRAPRRNHEHEGSFIDVYSPRLVMLITFFFFLTVLDSVSTVIYLRKGGTELNPVAQWMLDQGEIEFILIKGTLTAMCALFVLLHKNFRYAKGAIGIGFGFYFALAIYHIVLQVKAWPVPQHIFPS